MVDVRVSFGNIDLRFTYRLIIANDPHIAPEQTYGLVKKALDEVEGLKIPIISIPVFLFDKEEDNLLSDEFLIKAIEDFIDSKPITVENIYIIVGDRMDRQFHKRKGILEEAIYLKYRHNSMLP